ncbi:anaerobic ribonucleoside-triphosphate reductase family protein, partial [Vibrio parahaemolyticus V-223/04]
TLTTRSTSRCLTQKSQAVASSATVNSRTCNVT